MPARGWAIGSGSTNAMRKNLTVRQLRPGMKWDTDQASGMMNMAALRENRQWEAYWLARKVA